MEAFKKAGRALSEQRGRRPVLLQVVSARDSDTADPVLVELRGVNLDE